MSTDGVIIRPAEACDHPAILELNQAATPNVNAISAEGLRILAELASLFLVAEVDQRSVGFLLVLPHGRDYQSPNYRWFSKRYSRFAYVDRIVVSAPRRGLGVGCQLYSKLMAEADGSVPGVACEVNLKPPNPGSLRFHAAFGFEAVGELETEDGGKRVQLMWRPFGGH
jgi:predicted GNAT superfamily acetyltransferase